MRWLSLFAALMNEVKSSLSSSINHYQQSCRPQRGYPCGRRLRRYQQSCGRNAASASRHKAVAEGTDFVCGLGEVGTLTMSTTSTASRARQNSNWSGGDSPNLGEKHNLNCHATQHRRIEASRHRHILVRHRSIASQHRIAASQHLSAA